METTTKTAATIETEDLKNRIDSGSIQEFWNVLTDQYYRGELIPGSRRVSLDQIGRSVAGLPKDREIIVYCANYDCPQSHMAAEKLAGFGFTNVLVYEGGVQEWFDRGNEILNDETVAAHH